MTHMELRNPPPGTPALYPVLLPMVRVEETVGAIISMVLAAVLETVLGWIGEFVAAKATP